MKNISRRIAEHVSIVCLDKPEKLNVLDMGMLETLAHYCEEVEKIGDIRSLILCGRGDKAFCAGADIKSWGNMSPLGFAQDWLRAGHRCIDRLARLSKPTIAAMNGLALGGGLELAAACDLRVMAPHTEIGLPEARVGIVPGWSGTQRLARFLPESVIKEMALFGRRISAERAFDLGFAAMVTDQPVEAAQRMSAELVHLSGRAIETAKAMIHAGRGEDVAASIDMLAGHAMFTSPDIKEGVQAFQEKRLAKF